MDKDQENSLSMFKVVQGTVNNNLSVVSGITGFMTQDGLFNTKVSVIESTRNIQIGDISGFTVEKGMRKAEMITDTLKVSKGVVAFALATNNPGLKEQVDYSKSDLEDERDENVGGMCQIVHDRANENILELGDYNIVAADVTNLQTSIGDYGLVSQLPSQKGDIKQAATALLPTLFRETKDILKIMDAIVETLKETEPTFHSEYFNSREIYDLGGGGGGEEPPTP